MNAHAQRAAPFVANDARMHWHDKAVWYVRGNRDRAAASVPEWETLRELAAQVKAHTLSRLPDYLEEFERNALRLGAQVHWAADGAEHNRIVLSILEERGTKRLVKSKSMLTEECHLNDFLSEHGVEVVDTDLGERIVQLAKEAPSHIVLPAIHKKKEEIGELFHHFLQTEAGASDPKYLTEAARGHLREKFLAAEVGLTGVNFAIAETGGVVVCTNEGNADLGTSLPSVHIASMGVEKLIPRAADLGVFLRLLARSGTGQPITTYTSHFHGPRPGGRAPPDHRGQWPQRAPGQRDPPPLAELHPLWSLHEHLPRLSPQWRAQLRRHGPWAHRLGARSGQGCTAVRQPSLRFDAVRELHRRLPGEDRPPPPALPVAAGAGEAGPDPHPEAGGLECGELRAQAEAALRASGLAVAGAGAHAAAVAASLSHERLDPSAGAAAHAEGELPRPVEEATCLAGTRSWPACAVQRRRPSRFPSSRPPASASMTRWHTLPRCWPPSAAAANGLPRPACSPRRCGALPVVAQAAKVASLVPEAHPGNVPLATIDDPHALADVDVAIVRGEFAVAENGAVWVPARVLGRLQALPFITQHLVLVVDPAVVVHTLHEAYRRLRFDGPGFGLFISGPSKTADIELALVIGAHGARSATVFLVG